MTSMQAFPYNFGKAFFIRWAGYRRAERDEVRVFFGFFVPDGRAIPRRFPRRPGPDFGTEWLLKDAQGGR